MMGSGSIVSFLVALSFAAGLNVYATTATLGVLGRMHWVVLPAGLAMLENPWVLGASVGLFGLEMFADKIPFVDLVWNAAHTFVRVPVAALLAYRASAQLTPGMQALVVVMSAAIALVAHGGKTAARTVVTASPEPVSNIALSSAEDLFAVGLTWVATKHPVGAAVVVGVLVVGMGFGVRWVWGGVKGAWGRLLGGGVRGEAVKGG